MKQIPGYERDRNQIESRRFEHPLPPVLYHITTKNNADKILEEGLSPSLRMQGDTKVVSLTDDIAFGKRVATETQSIENPDELVILQIDTSKLDRDAAESFLMEKVKDVLLPDLKKILEKTNPSALEEHLHEVHYHNSIPAEAISILKAADRDGSLKS